MPRIGESLRQNPVPSALRHTTPGAVRSTPASTGLKPLRPLGFSQVSSFTAHGITGSRPNKTFKSLEKLSPNDLGVLAQHQGYTNACGTTSLANVMTHWGMPRTHEQIDKSIRAFDLFTAPDKIVKYARANGLRAQMKVGANLDDITGMVDKGVPPIVLMDPDSGNNLQLHYITVTGYNRGADGKVTNLVIADSATGTRYTMNASDFEQKWAHLRMKNISTGLHNVMITAVPADGRAITGGDGKVRRASTIQLPKSSFSSTLKSLVARGLANAISNGAILLEKGWRVIKAVGKAATAVGNAIGKAAKAVGGFFKKLFG